MSSKEKIDHALRSRVINKFSVKCENITYNCRGHTYRLSEDLKSLISRYYLLSFFRMDKENLTRLDSQDVPNPPILIDYCGGRTCLNCNWDGTYTFDGKTFFATEQCAHPNGIENITIDLNIPSGKMVFANDLRKWFRVHTDYNINNNGGIFDTIKAYEKVGMAHGFVGNSCPSVYKVDKENLSISSYGMPVDEEDRGDEDKWIHPVGKEVGGICTDLWWYCIVDLEDFKRRFFDMGGTAEDFKNEIKHCDIVNVKPGVYRILHNFIDDDNCIGKPTNYAIISWARKPEVSSLYEEYNKLNYTIGQCYLATMAEYPSLYGFEACELPKHLSVTDRIAKLLTYPVDRLENSVAAFYSRVFYNEREGDWHSNGWGCSCNIPKDMPDFKLPPLTTSHAWYPTSKESSILYAASRKGNRLPLNESFLNAAYQVIYSILEFGVKPFFNPPRDIEMKKSIEIAEECLRGLSEHYVVPDFLQKLLK